MIPSAAAISYSPHVIDTDDRLQSFLPVLRAALWLALDTEADSLHAYPEKICLIQISCDGYDELLDPLSETMNLKPLFEVLQGRELILHGADYDLRMLRKNCDFVPTAIFDTMLASRLLGCREFGLVNLVQSFLGVTLEKGPQKANWARRPLTPRMEAYARNDTRYLQPLAALFREQLIASGRLEWHREMCEALVAECAEPRTPDPDQVWRVKGSHALTPPALAVLREIWRWRETEAIGACKPPFFILSPDAMVNLAGAAAAHRPLHDQLPKFLTPRRRQGVLRAISEGLATPQIPSVIRHRGQRQTEAEKKRSLELEKRRDQRAEEFGIDATLIASRATLVALARDWNAHKHELLPWQRALLAD